MAVIEVQKAHLTKGSAKQDSDGDTVTDVYHVLLDAKPGDFDELIDMFVAETGLTKGRPYKTGDTRLLKSITPAKIQSITDYTIEVEYAEPDDDAGNSSGEENPLLRKDERSVSGSSSQQPYFKDNSEEPQ